MQVVYRAGNNPSAKVRKRSAVITFTGDMGWAYRSFSQGLLQWFLCKICEEAELRGENT